MEKKIGKKVVALGLSMTMLSGQLASSMTSVLAQEPQDNTEDYSDTTRMRSVDTLEASNVKVDKTFNVSPLYDIENNELLLPRIKGYKVEVFGSDNKATISLDGKVTRPIVTQTVKLLYKITNEADGTSITTETNAVVKIPARETDVVGENSKPQVIPELREWVASDGQVDLTNARIVLGTEKFREAAKTFKADYKDLTGRDISIVIGNGTNLSKGDIFIGEATGETMLGDEGYYMNIGGEKADQEYVEIKATHNIGALYGGISILQILKQDTTGRNNLPKGLVKDYPEFEQRGMMLDVARKWIPMEYLKDLTKQMSWYKLNMLSLHLSDNDIWNGLSTENGLNGAPEGWFRLECETFPELTSPEHYTKEEFRNLQYDSMDLGIDVIPELDTPGHALSYTNAWEGTARHDNAKYLDVLNPTVLENSKKMFDEYINGYKGGEATFVGNHVNIGTDEYKTGGLDATLARQYREGFRKYCNDLLEYVNSTGKEAVFWGSLTENSGTTPVTTDATMFAWYQGYANAKQSLDAGYKIISMEDMEVYIVPGGGYYSNQFGRAEYLYNSWLPNRNSGWAGNNAPDGHPGVTGGQFAVWNDFHGNGISVNDISYRIQHNLYTIAEKTWAGTQSKDEGKSYAEIKKLAATLGDAPNADFLYEIDKTVTNNEVIQLDDVATNKITNGVAITNNTNVSENVAGKNGNGLKLNGGESYLTTELKSAGFGWTTSMWINPTADGTLMEGKTGKLRLEDGKIKYDVENYTHTFNCNIEMDKWTHIALTGTFEGVSLYINGEKFDSLIGKAFPNWNPNSGCNSWSGSYPVNEKGQQTQRYYETLMLPMEYIGSKDEAIQAAVDELNIYNKVLTDNEIAKLAGAQTGDVFENLALNKTVTASGSEVAKWGPEKVVDGNTSGNDSRWSSNYSDSAWLTVDLGKGQNVNNIKIFWEAAYGKKYKILVSEDNSTWQEVYNEENGKGGVKDIKFDMKENIRYIKFQGVERTPASDGVKYGFSFYELEVYGDKVVGDYERQNVALKKTVTVDDYNHNPDPGTVRTGDKAVDGDLDSRWEFSLGTTTNSITIPLNNDEDVDKIILKEKVWGSEKTRISKVKVEIISNGVATEVLPATNYQSETVEGTANMKQATGTINLAQAVKGDAIKITIIPAGTSDAYMVNIAELELYGTKAKEESPEEPTDPVVVRNHTKISQSTMSATATSEHPNVGSEGLASMAIDSNMSTWWHTNWSNPVALPQSITLNLHEIKTIGKYTYLPRPGAGNGTISKYILETSVDGKNYTKVAEGTWLVNDVEKIVEFAPTHAQYIRLTALEGKGGFASAAELNVYKTEAKLKTDLQKLVTEADMINFDGYLASTTIEYKKAIEDAKKLLEGDPTETQIAAASKAIQAGLDALDIAGDKTELTILYNANKDVAETDYVKSSFEEFSIALKEAKDLIDSTTTVAQKDLNAARNKIIGAKSRLISIVDLRDWIDVASAIDTTDATKASADELRLRLTNAKNVLVNDNVTANQVEIATYRLNVAYDELVGDTTALEELINSYKETDYTSSSWETFTISLDNAKQLLNKKDVTVTELTAARSDLVKAAGNLILVSNKTLLKIAIEVANEVTEVELSKVVPAVVEEFKAALAEATKVLANKDATQEEVNNSFDRLASAMQKLSFYKGDKEALIGMVERIEKLNRDDYISTTLEAVDAEMIKAKEIIADENAMEKEVKEITDSLTRAFLQLRLKPNKALLEDLINQAEQINANLYTKESYVALAIALENAKNVFSIEDVSQEKVDEAVNILKEAIEGLVNVETPDVKPVPNPDGTVKPGEGTIAKPSSSATGDNTSLEAFLLAGGAALGAMLIARKKRREN